jgi:hypothetical protein
MIKVNKHGIILQKTTLGFENEAVLNPAAIQEGKLMPKRCESYNK